MRAVAKEFRASTLEPRDRGLARLIAATVLRRLGELEAVLNSYLEKPLPKQKGALWPILLSGAAQLLFLETPPHAAVGLAVDQTRGDRHAGRYDKLVNALLRRVSREGAAALRSQDAVALNVPAWMLQRWTDAYGAEEARRIAGASLNEAPLDISVKSSPEAWAERLGGKVLPTGSVRLEAGGRIEDLPGYSDGGWWVQDAAASLPARLLGPVAGKSVADLCAAPGGKTAQLAAAGADVTAVDLSSSRLQRLRDNLARLNLKAQVVEGDAGTWAPGSTFDAVLLDVPCTSTGTIRRHPDILRLKRAEDVVALAEVQSRLLDNAARLVASGGVARLLHVLARARGRPAASRTVPLSQPRVRAVADCGGRAWNCCRLADARWRSAHAAALPCRRVARTLGDGRLLRRAAPSPRLIHSSAGAAHRRARPPPCLRPPTGVVRTSGAGVSRGLHGGTDAERPVAQGGDDGR